MTESQHAVISRLSAEFDSLARQMARVSGELSQLDRLISDSVGAAAACGSVLVPLLAAVGATGAHCCQ